MNLHELNKYLQSIPDQIMDQAPDIVAETATEYFKSTFRTKAFNGNPWAAPLKPKQTGSLLIESGALLNSIRPVIVSRQVVKISAGNDKVTYAAIHNEGFNGTIDVSAHTRDTKKYGDVQVRAHMRQANIPQRQFMGDAGELNDQIHDRLEGYVESLNL